jgi:leucine-zipper of insertion element IS481
MSHARGCSKPRLSLWSRLLLVERVLAGRPAAHVAAEMGVSRATAYKWLARFRLEGTAGLSDRSSRSHRSPGRTDPLLEAQIVALRRDRRVGAGADRLDPGHACLDGAPGPDPARDASAVVAGPPHRAAHPSLRAGPTRRAGTRRWEEDRPTPRWRRLAGSRPRQPRTAPSPGRDPGRL